MIFRGFREETLKKIGRVWYDKKVGSQRVAVSCIGGSSFFVVPASRRSGDGVSEDHRHGGTDQRAIRAGDALWRRAGYPAGRRFCDFRHETHLHRRHGCRRCGMGLDHDGERGHSDGRSRRVRRTHGRRQKRHRFRDIRMAGSLGWRIFFLSRLQRKRAGDAGLRYAS